MKILLIDDLALRGWKQVLEKAVTQTSIDVVENIEKAKEKLKEKYDLIFLDMRLGEEDHKKTDVKEFGGFKLLKEIKSDFRNTNFSTPIILITASNKIWNIDKFKEYGVDFCYIKEHPNYV
ncbi:response regulator [Capnocytophaga gingivalis]